jgi:hypothetical protein
VDVRRDAAKIGCVPMLPRSDRSLLVRTDFTSDKAWQQVSGAAQATCADGFQAYIEPVSDPAFDSVPWQVVKAALPPNDHGALVLFCRRQGDAERQTIIRYWSWASCPTGASRRSVASQLRCGASRTTSISRTWTGRTSRTRSMQTASSAASAASASSPSADLRHVVCGRRKRDRYSRRPVGGIVRFRRASRTVG